MDAAVAATENDGTTEGPWPLPAVWTWAKIEVVLAPMEDGRIIHHGWSPQCEAFSSESVDTWGVLKTTAVQPGVFLAYENKALPRHLAARANLEVHAGDILLTCAGPRSRCGVACLVRKTRPLLIFSGKMYRFRPAPNVMEAGFLEAFLQTYHVWQAIDAMKTGGSDSGLNLTHDRFRQLLVPLAPLAEQRRILARVDALFAEIAEGEAALAAARRGIDTFRRALLKAAVTGELTKDWRAANPVTETGHDLLARISKDRAATSTSKDGVQRNVDSKPIDISCLTELPEGWAWATAAELFKWSSGDFLPTPRMEPGPIPVYGGNGIAGTHLRHNVLTPTIIVGRVGFYCGAIHVSNGPTWITDNAIFAKEWPTLCELEFLSLVLEHSNLRQRSQGGAQPFINQKILNETVLPIPPALEQVEILRRVSETLTASADTLTILDAEAADAARLKQSILKAAFEGHLVPQDSADEPASALLERLALNQPAKRGRGRKSNV